DVVNYDGNYPYGKAPKGTDRQKTVAVGSLGVANAWGIFDLHGNVREWVEDEWHDSYNGAPMDGRARMDIFGRASSRVLRGGGWSNFAVYCRSSDRRSDSPGTRGHDLGFRLSRTASGR
ncbi:MAG: formylglycine-generating enzyme family protein, partial [Acidobacteria bacterium]|nr:formylglycine-generating enzyme family protein [Acidobacteriota bacterium]